MSNKSKNSTDEHSKTKYPSYCEALYGLASKLSPSEEYGCIRSAIDTEDLPTFERLSNGDTVDPEIPNSYQISRNYNFTIKFLSDLRVGDRICARIKRIGVVVLQVELVCMLSRFMRSLKFYGTIFEIPFDRSKRIYQTNDYIAVIVRSIDQNSATLELAIDENETLNQSEDLHLYCRKFASPMTSYESDPAIARLRDNPNLAAKLHVRINLPPSLLPQLQQKELYNASTSAEVLRKEQTHKLAMNHVEKGASLTRDCKYFEAIQCFNKALAVDEFCADAFVGRGAALAGNRNFPAAIIDFDKALELQPDHKNAHRYKIDVLLANAKEMEKERNFENAKEGYEEILRISRDHPLAIEGLRRIENGIKKGTEVIQLDDDDDEIQHNGTNRKRKQSLSIEIIEHNSRKLREMEEFIEKLKRSK